VLIAGVDTGLRRCGVALFEDGTLIWAQLVEADGAGDDVFAMAHAVAGALPKRPGQVFVEVPQQYPSSPVPRKSLEQLTLVAGAITHALSASDVSRIYPRQWKGQVPKPVMLRRIQSHLTDPEKTLVEDLSLPTSTAHNVWDAVGICLWAAGRIGVRVGR